MKRGILLLALLLLTSPIILAEENNTDISQAKEQLSALKGGLDEKTENILEKEIQVPEELKFILILIKGIKGGVNTISWKELIGFITIAVFIFMFFMEILEFTAFESNWVKFTIAATITLIFSTLGAINKITTMLYTLVNNIWIFLGILIATILLLFFAKSFLDIVKRQKKISKAEELGIKSGAALKGMSKISEAAVSAAK